MQGRQRQQQELFSTVTLQDLVPQDHLLRKIDKVIDLQFIYQLTDELYCKDNGRPSIDPVLFFRMQLVGYLYGIASDRELCREIHLNVAYRWFCRLPFTEKVPHHSSLTRIRERLGNKTFQTIFESLIDRWQQKGIVSGKRIISDASIFEADASLDSMLEREENDPQKRPLKPHENRYHDFRQGKKRRKISNQTHVSKTDKDATLVMNKGSYRKLSYKTHYSIDAKTRIITDCHTTTGSRHESPVLQERLEYQLQRFHFPLEEVIADRGYGSGPTYSYLREKKIRAYIPLHSDNLGQGRISRGSFRYDRRNDRYICPNNRYLYPYEKRDRDIKRYRIIGKHCRTCRMKRECVPHNFKNRSRFIYRSPHQDEIDKIRKRQVTKTFKKKQSERRWKIEGLFGEAKNNHNLRRAKYRGLQKVQIQVYLIAIVQNLKRLVAFFIYIRILIAVVRSLWCQTTVSHREVRIIAADV